MGVYTDPRLLDVRGAVEKLPALPLPGGPGAVAPAVAPTRCNREQFGSSEGTEGSADESKTDGDEGGGNAGNVNEKPPLTTQVSGGHRKFIRASNPQTQSKSGPTSTLHYLAIIASSEGVAL